MYVYGRLDQSAVTLDQVRRRSTSAAHMIMSLIVFLCLFGLNVARNIEDYKITRTRLLEEELKLQVGGDLELNEEEIIVNDILMRYKRMEIDESLKNNEFNLSKHYFTFRDEIKNSKVYQIIRDMPKGAALHVHSTLMLSAQRLVELTYEKYLYSCISADDLKLQFSYDAPLSPCTRKWELLSDIRQASDNVTQFDANLAKYFTLYSEDEKNMMYDVNFAWTRFVKLCATIGNFIKYRPIREKFFYNVLKEMYNDNIMYVEFRTGLAYLYEINGTVHDKTYFAHLYNTVAERFKKEYPDFVGVKLIITKQRSVNVNQLKQTIDIARKIKRELPDFVAGFDLVAQEDLGKPLIDFYPILEEVKHEMNFYFHAGETNWQGTAIDENLFDAILLGSKRIGHGFALIKHPTLLASIKENDVAIEVNVISNLVLSLLCDIRNHPLASYLAGGLPVVISSDDPGAWGADPLSHDYYLTFVAIASKHADLRMLKQLVINSIKYSALDKNEKYIIMKQLSEKWNTFIRNIIKEHIRDF